MENYLLDKMLRYKLIPSDKSEVYLYGLQILLNSVWTSLSILIVAILLDSFFIAMLYFLITIPLRMTCGGYHASKYSSCFIISNLTYVMVSLMTKVLIFWNLPKIGWFSTLYISALFIHLNAPIENIHHPLSQQKKKRNKYLCLSFLSADLLVLSVFLAYDVCSTYSRFSIIAILMVAIMIIPAYRKGGEPKCD